MAGYQGVCGYRELGSQRGSLILYETGEVVMAYYLRTKTHVAGALHVGAIWDLHYQNC